MVADIHSPVNLWLQKVQATDFSAVQLFIPVKGEADLFLPFFPTCRWVSTHVFVWLVSGQIMWSVLESNFIFYVFSEVSSVLSVELWILQKQNFLHALVISHLNSGPALSHHCPAVCLAFFSVTFLHSPHFCCLSNEYFLLTRAGSVTHVYSPVWTGRMQSGCVSVCVANVLPSSKVSKVITIGDPNTVIGYSPGREGWGAK